MLEWEKQDPRRAMSPRGSPRVRVSESGPALLIVDFINGFTDPSSPLGGDFSSASWMRRTPCWTRSGRAALPVVYTVIEYEPGFRDAGVFIQKVPSLSVLLRGSPMCAVDDRIAAVAGRVHRVQEVREFVLRDESRHPFPDARGRYLRDRRLHDLRLRPRLGGRFATVRLSRPSSCATAAATGRTGRTRRISSTSTPSTATSFRAGRMPGIYVNGLTPYGRAAVGGVRPWAAPLPSTTCWPKAADSWTR